MTLSFRQRQACNRQLNGANKKGRAPSLAALPLTLESGVYFVLKNAVMTVPSAAVMLT